MNFMRSVKFLYYIFILFAFMISCSGSSEKAAEYCNRITNEHNKVMCAIEKLDSAFAEYKAPEKMDSAHRYLVTTVDSVEQVLTNLSGPEDNELKKTTLQLIDIYKKTAENEFSEMIRLYKLSDTNYAQAEMDEWEKLSLEAYNKIKNAQKKFIQEQIRYSEKFGFNLEDRKK